MKVDPYVIHIFRLAPGTAAIIKEEPPPTFQSSVQFGLGKRIGSHSA